MKTKKLGRQNMWQYFVMLIPGVILTFIFSYIPLYGVINAFEDYNVGLGFRSPWVGLNNFRYLFSQPTFTRTIWNTLYIAVWKLALGIVVPVTVAVLLNEMRSNRLKRFYQTLIYIPNFLSWILPGALPVYNMIILMNFMRGLPHEVEEAAWIDGATPFQTLVQVIFPLLAPSLATVGLFSMVGHWNDWFAGMIYMSDPLNYPLQTYLQTLLVDFEKLLQSDTSGNIKDILSKMNARTGRAAQLFLGALPIMCVYPFLQRYFTKGLTLGSVKG